MSATRTLTFRIQAPPPTRLAWWANQLSSGQSVRIDADGQSHSQAIPTPTNAHLRPPGEGGQLFSGFLINSTKGVYNPFTKELSYIGRTLGSGFFWLTFAEQDNNGAGVWYSSAPTTPTLNNPARTLPWAQWDFTGASGPLDAGHGFDGNGIDAATGRMFFQQQNRDYVHVWNGTSWGVTQNTPDALGAASTQFVPGVGLLVHCDDPPTQRLLRCAGDAGSAWTALVDLGATRYEKTTSAYDPATGVFVYGGGKDVSSTTPMPMRAWSVTQLNGGTTGTPLTEQPWDKFGSATPLHRVGMGTWNSQDAGGFLAAAPGTRMVARFRRDNATPTTDNPRWARLDLATGLWTGLIGTPTTATWDGQAVSNLRNGPPVFTNNDNTGAGEIVFQVDAYGVIVTLSVATGTASGREVWMYKP